MKLVTVEATFAPKDVATSTTLFEDQASGARDMDGCAGYDLYAATDGGGKIVIVQRWISMEAFDAYRQSETFARLAEGLKPIMTAPPITTVNDVSP